MVHGRLIVFLRHAAAWLAGRRRLLRIEGSSLCRTLPAGSLAWWEPGAYRVRPPEVRDLVLASHPYRRDLFLVKRVERLEPDGRLFLVGDEEAESTDSRHFGPVEREAIRGRVRPLFP